MVARTFSLAMLFRATTLISLALGWWVLISRTSAISAFVAIIFVMTILATIVGYRRRGSLFDRLWATLLFLLGGASIAFYSGFVAQLVEATQKPTTDRHAWDGLNEMILFVFIFASLPIMIVVLVFMLRSWTWSAHDQAQSGES